MEEFLPWMNSANLETYHDFYEKKVGVLLKKRKGGKELCRLTLEVDGATRDFYLKRLGREPVSQLLQMVLFFRLPSTGPIRELKLLKKLQQAGFVTMRPAAFGEKRFLGWPVGGFLVVEAVDGIGVADLVCRQDIIFLRHLFHDLGIFLGRLHMAGFFQVVRLKDLFCPFVPFVRKQNFDFVLIDRETSKPWQTRVSRKSCFRSLARMARRILRDGHRIGHGELRSFFQGYLAVCEKTFGDMNMMTFRKEFFSALRQENEKRR